MSGAGYPNLTERDLAQQRAANYSIQQQQQQQQQQAANSSYGRYGLQQQQPIQQQQRGAYNAAPQYARPAPVARDNQQAYMNGLGAQDLARKAEMAANTLMNAGRIGGNALLGNELDQANLGEYSRPTTTSAAVSAPTYISAGQNYGHQQQQRFNTGTERQGAANTGVGYQLGHDAPQQPPQQQQQQSYFPNVGSSSAQSQQTAAPAPVHRQQYANVNAGYYQPSPPQAIARPVSRDQQRVPQQAQQQHSAINPVRVPTPTQSHGAPLSSAHSYSQTAAAAAAGVPKQTQGAYGQTQQALRMSQSPSMVATKIHSTHTAQTQAQKRSPAIASTQWGQNQVQSGFSANQGPTPQQQQQNQMSAQTQQYNSHELQPQQQQELQSRQYQEMRARQYQAQQAQVQSLQPPQAQQPVQHFVQSARPVEAPPQQQQQETVSQYGRTHGAQNVGQQHGGAPSGRPSAQTQAPAQARSSASPAVRYEPPVAKARPSSAASQRSTTSSRGSRSKPPPKLYLPQAPPPAQPQKSSVQIQKQAEVPEIVSHVVRQEVEAAQQNRAQPETAPISGEVTTPDVPTHHHEVKHHQTQSPSHHQTFQPPSANQSYPPPPVLNKTSPYPHSNYLPLAHIHSQPPEPRQPEPPQQYIHPQYLYNRPLTPPSRALPDSPLPATPAAEDTAPVVEPLPPMQQDPESAAPAIPASPPPAAAAPGESISEQPPAPAKMSAPDNAAPPVTPSAPQQTQPSPMPAIPGMPPLDPTAPLDPSQMEAHMRALVETMRFYQSRDPNTFHSIWESVRKDSASKPAIMPAGEPSQTSPTPAARPSDDQPVHTPTSAPQLVNVAVNNHVSVPKLATPARTPDVNLSEDAMDIDPSTPAVETVKKQRCSRASKPGSQARRKNPPTPIPRQLPLSTHLEPVLIGDTPEPQPAPESHRPIVKPPVEPPRPAPAPPPYVTPAEANKKDAEHAAIMQASRSYFLQNFCVEIDMNELRAILDKSINFPMMCSHFEKKGFRFDRGLFAKYLQAKLQGSNNPKSNDPSNQQNGNSAAGATEVGNNGPAQDPSGNGQVDVPTPGRVLGELVDPQQRAAQANLAKPRTVPVAPSRPAPYASPNFQPIIQGVLANTASHVRQGPVAQLASQQPQGPFTGASIGQQPMGFQNNHQQFAQHHNMTFRQPLQNGSNPLSYPQQGFQGFNAPNSTMVLQSVGQQHLSSQNPRTMQNFNTNPQFGHHVAGHVPIHIQNPSFNSLRFGAEPQYIRSGLPQSSGFYAAPSFPQPANNIVDLTRDPSPPKQIQRPPLLNLSHRKQDKLDPTVPLALPLKREQALRKNKYKKASVCRNILRITGRHPTEPALNEHLLPLKDNLHLDLKSDLETVRWDLLDPEQPNQEVDAGMEADNEGDGGRAVDAVQTPAVKKRKPKKSAAPGSLTTRVQQQGSHLDTSDASTPTIANQTTNLDYETDSDVEHPGARSKMSSAKRPRLTGPDGDGSEFKKYVCKWHSCAAVLHNLDTLKLHLQKRHRGKNSNPSSGNFQCLWANCPDSSNEFKTLEEWDAHVAKHTDEVFQLLGLGPRVNASEVDSAGSDVDYLSDSRGVQVTPIARLAPPDYHFTPPAGHKANAPFKQVHPATKRQPAGRQTVIEQAKKLGAGIQRVDNVPKKTQLDDGLGLDIAIMRVAPK